MPGRSEVSIATTNSCRLQLYTVLGVWLAIDALQFVTLHRSNICSPPVLLLCIAHVSQTTERTTNKSSSSLQAIMFERKLHDGRQLNKQFQLYGFSSFLAQ